MPEPSPGAFAAAVPLPGVDPRVALASTLHASATTAALLGSGVSRAAGIRTGWDVALDLVRRYAKASGVQGELEDPEAWWRQSQGSPLAYDTVLSGLAPTDASRRDLLRRYFEIDGAGRPYEPTRAHRALAQLAAQGRLRVILTTNFDHLMENALREVGIVPQVLTRPSDVNGMIPLQHAPMTLVKLHGDYASGRLLNDPDELGTYKRPWRVLLHRVFSEYGLMVLGWSADYDRALERAVAKSIGRRYAWYWVTYRGTLTDRARRLVDLRGAHLIDSEGADEFAADLLERVDTLDRRAQQRRRPRPTVAFSGLQGISVAGWESQVPLVHARVEAALHGSADALSIIDASARKALFNSLNGGRLSQLLERLDAAHLPATTDPSYAPGAPAGPLEASTRRWRPPEGASQSAVSAVYAWGSLGGPGTSALVSVALPEATMTNEMRLRVDLGLSYTEGVEDVTFAGALRDCLLAAAADLPSAMDGVLHDAQPLTRIEVHWDVPQSRHGLNRPVPDGNTVHFDRLGSENALMHRSGRDAEQPAGDELTVTEANAFICRALEHIALNKGLLDPA